MTAASRLAVAHLRGHDHVDAGETCDVSLSVVDALSVAHSIRTLIRNGTIPRGTAEIYERVALQMISSARARGAQLQAEKDARSIEIVAGLKAMGGAR